MIDAITGKKTNFKKDIPYSSIIIDEKGKIEIFFKKETIEEIDGKQMELNYHIDFLHYYVKKKKLAPNEEIEKIIEEHNQMKFVKILTNKKYVVVLNLDYFVYSFLNIPRETLIVTNKQITKEQLQAIKSIKDQLKNIRLCTMDNENDNEIEVKYNELIEKLERKAVKK